MCKSTWRIVTAHTSLVVGRVNAANVYSTTGKWENYLRASSHQTLKKPTTDRFRGLYPYTQDNARGKQFLLNLFFPLLTIFRSFIGYLGFRFRSSFLLFRHGGRFLQDLLGVFVHYLKVYG